MDVIVITEGVAGYYHYHLSLKEKTSKGFCGALTMPTAIPLSEWGKPGGEHLAKKYTYCKECSARFFK
jgi:hypothetical protein